MTGRIFAIDNQNNQCVEYVVDLVKSIRQYNCADDIVVFTKEDLDAFHIENAKIVKFDQTLDNHSKCKNYINSFFKQQNFEGFLHVLEDNVQLKQDPTNYMNVLEHCMDVLDYDVYFSTTSDGCNYVYSKFNPRVRIQLDSPAFSSLNLPQNISFTSHSNTAWVTYNFKKIDEDLLKFNENFDIPMYFIIEFLARRRNTKKPGSLYLMNQYLSISQEVGVFETINLNISNQNIQQQMAKEDAIFKSMNLNFVPDNNIDQLLVDVINKLKSKV